MGIPRFHVPRKPAPQPRLRGFRLSSRPLLPRPAHVKSGAAIKLNFKAVIANTRVKIKSGSSMHDIIVGTDWYDGNTPSSFTVTSQDTTIKVYNNITGFEA